MSETGELDGDGPGWRVSYRDIDGPDPRLDEVLIWLRWTENGHLLVLVRPELLMLSAVQWLLPD